MLEAQVSEMFSQQKCLSLLNDSSVARKNLLAERSKGSSCSLSPTQEVKMFSSLLLA